MAAAKKKKKAKLVRLKHTQMSWDWKEQPDEEELNKLLKPFGVHVTAHPACEGQDSYGFIFSNRPLTEEELQEASETM